MMAITPGLDGFPSYSVSTVNQAASALGGMYHDSFIRQGQFGAGGLSPWNFSQFQGLAQTVTTGMQQPPPTTDENGFKFTDMINNPGGAFLVGLVLLGMSGFRG